MEIQEGGMYRSNTSHGQCINETGIGMVPREGSDVVPRSSLEQPREQQTKTKSKGTKTRALRLETKTKTLAQGAQTRAKGQTRCGRDSENQVLPTYWTVGVSTTHDVARRG